MAEFTNDIRHIAGADNVVADILSWPPTSMMINAVAASGQQLDYAAIPDAQQDCPSIATAGDSALHLKLVLFGIIRVL